ncbi:MAG: dockerin type I repeat-containing protein [Acutalibacteraceae bacterium]|nr:dockerin type I repeat-containing protein [Acutalibacteraceae bacterium]
MFKITNNTNLLHTFLKLIVSLYIVVISAFFFSLSPNANAYYTCKVNGIMSNSALHYDNNGVYITSFSGSNLEINYIINNTIDKRTLKISGEIKGTATDNGIIYFISYNNNTVFINKYDYNADTLNSFIIKDSEINSAYNFAVSNNRLYFTTNKNCNTMTCYSIYGEKLYSIYLDSIIDYCTGNDNKLYIVTQNQLYSLDTTGNYQPVCILNGIDIRSNIFFCDNTFFDYDGQIINSENNTVISTNIDCKQLNGAVASEYYCKYHSNNIYGYDNRNIEYILYNINAGENAQMCSYQGKIYLLSENRELFIIEQSELHFPVIEDNNNTPSNNHTHSNTTPTTPTAKPQINNSSCNTDKKEFSINNYYIDTDKNIIWDIPSGTTIAGLKNNLTYNGYELNFYNKDNVKKTGGNIGTGFTMVVESNNTEFCRYSISVKGDLSGEGNISKADVKILSEYFMNVSTLTDEQYTASDCNGDNIIDGVDILKIARNNL